MDCKIANDIKGCVTEKLICSDNMDAKELAKEFIWSITDAICIIRYEWIITVGSLWFIFWLNPYIFLSKSNEADAYLKNKNWYYCGWDFGALNYGAILISVAVNIFLICITACVTKSKIKKN